MHPLEKHLLMQIKSKRTQRNSSDHYEAKAFDYERYLYEKHVYMSSTMSPGISVDAKSVS